MDTPTRHDNAHDGTIVLRVPGTGQFLEILRGAVGRATRISGFSFDGIEDFSLVVDEAAVLLLESGPANLELTLTGVAEGRDGVQADLAMPDFDGEWPPPDLFGGTRWQIIQALCESVSILDDEVRGRGISLGQSVR